LQHTKNVRYIGAASSRAEYFNKHAKRSNLKRDCAILDVGAGTGSIGVAVRTIYTYIYTNKYYISISVIRREEEKEQVYETKRRPNCKKHPMCSEVRN